MYAGGSGVYVEPLPGLMMIIADELKPFMSSSWIRSAFRSFITMASVSLDLKIIPNVILIEISQSCAH